MISHLINSDKQDFPKSGVCNRSGVCIRRIGKEAEVRRGITRGQEAGEGYGLGGGKGRGMREGGGDVENANGGASGVCAWRKRRGRGGVCGERR